jgi:hypothetical protein
MAGKIQILKNIKRIKISFYQHILSTSTFNSRISPFTRETTVWFGKFPLPVCYLTFIKVKIHVRIIIILVKYGYETQSNNK